MVELLVIKDVETGQTYKVRPNLNTDRFVTRDGVEVRVHPVSIKLMVPKNQEFDGQTLTGPRKLRRL